MTIEVSLSEEGTRYGNPASLRFYDTDGEWTSFIPRMFFMDSRHKQ